MRERTATIVSAGYAEHRDVISYTAEFDDGSTVSALAHLWFGDSVTLDPDGMEAVADKMVGEEITVQVEVGEE